LNSRVSNWPTAVFNAMEVFKNDFRCITMDQRNANSGESTGPVQVDNPWDAFADDQLGLMDHLGIREFFYMCYCIGGCFAGKLMQRAPTRVVAAVFCQTVGHLPEDPTVMYRHSKENWAPDFMKRRPDVSTDMIEKYLHNLYVVQPDFLFSVSRDFIRSCRTPMLVLPDDVPAHPLQTSIDVASLAPNAEITVFPWKEPEELKQRTIDRVRRFLQAHTSGWRRRAIARSTPRSGEKPRPRDAARSLTMWGRGSVPGPSGWTPRLSKRPLRRGRHADRHSVHAAHLRGHGRGGGNRDQRAHESRPSCGQGSWREAGQPAAAGRQPGPGAHGGRGEVREGDGAGDGPPPGDRPRSGPPASLR
jgi:pimeloyl-ACP methyl ester carboxylesterase